MKGSKSRTGVTILKEVRVEDVDSSTPIWGEPALYTRAITRRPDFDDHGRRVLKASNVHVMPGPSEHKKYGCLRDRETTIYPGV